MAKWKMAGKKPAKKAKIESTGSSNTPKIRNYEDIQKVLSSNQYTNKTKMQAYKSYLGNKKVNTAATNTNTVSGAPRNMEEEVGSYESRYRTPADFMKQHPEVGENIRKTKNIEAASQRRGFKVGTTEAQIAVGHAVNNFGGSFNKGKAKTAKSKLDSATRAYVSYLQGTREFNYKGAKQPVANPFYGKKNSEILDSINSRFSNEIFGYKLPESEEKEGTGQLTPVSAYDWHKNNIEHIRRNYTKNVLLSKNTVNITKENQAKAKAAADQIQAIVIGKDPEKATVKDIEEAEKSARLRKEELIRQAKEDRHALETGKAIIKKQPSKENLKTVSTRNLQTNISKNFLPDKIMIKPGGNIRESSYEIDPKNFTMPGYKSPYIEAEEPKEKKAKKQPSSSDYSDFDEPADESMDFDINDIEGTVDKLKKASAGAENAAPKASKPKGAKTGDRFANFDKPVSEEDIVKKAQDMISRHQWSKSQEEYDAQRAANAKKIAEFKKLHSKK